MPAKPVLARHMALAGGLLALFATVCVALVAGTHALTRARIAESERLALVRSLAEVLPATLYDNDIATDTVQVQAPEWLGSRERMTVYRGRQGGRPSALVLSAVAPDGYAGDIRLLVGVRYDGALTGVRVLSHRETPGLGDRIDAARSDWILGFVGRSLRDPSPEKWRVRRDGGVFDQFTGATITPRAVVTAVRKCLQFYARERDALFATPSPDSEARRT